MSLYRNYGFPHFCLNKIVRFSVFRFCRVARWEAFSGLCNRPVRKRLQRVSHGEPWKFRYRRQERSRDRSAINLMGATAIRLPRRLNNMRFSGVRVSSNCANNFVIHPHAAFSLFVFQSFAQYQRVLSVLSLQYTRYTSIARHCICCENAIIRVRDHTCIISARINARVSKVLSSINSSVRDTAYHDSVILSR